MLILALSFCFKAAKPSIWRPQQIYTGSLAMACEGSENGSGNVDVKPAFA